MAPRSQFDTEDIAFAEEGLAELRNVDAPDPTRAVCARLARRRRRRRIAAAAGVAACCAAAVLWALPLSRTAQSPPARSVAAVSRAQTAESARPVKLPAREELRTEESTDTEAPAPSDRRPVETGTPSSADIAAEEPAPAQPPLDPKLLEPCHQWTVIAAAPPERGSGSWMTFDPAYRSLGIRSRPESRRMRYPDASGGELWGDS